MDRMKLLDAARQIGEIARHSPPASGPEEAAAWQAYQRILGDVRAKLEAAAARAVPAPAAGRAPAGRPRPAAGRPMVRPATRSPVVAGRTPLTGGAAGGGESLADFSQMLQLQLQDAMNKQQQLLQMLSNIMKSQHDTAVSIINNMK